MRTLATILMPLLAALLFVAGCGGGGREGGEAPTEEGPEATTPTVSEITAPAAKPETAQQLPTLTIVNSFGEAVPVRVEIADTWDEQTRGLMERTALAEDAGMLFVFDRELQLPFTMKNTLIPLSIAFIDAEGRIVDILDMQPLDETTPYASAAPYQYALEVNQGFFRERGVEVGNFVELPELSSAP
jgi:uncharacterized membrane protein (UPF0127 family)